MSILIAVVVVVVVTITITVSFIIIRVWRTAERLPSSRRRGCHPLNKQSPLGQRNRGNGFLELGLVLRTLCPGSKNPLPQVLRPGFGSKNPLPLFRCPKGLCLLKLAKRGRDKRGLNLSRRMCVRFAGTPFSQPSLAICDPICDPIPPVKNSKRLLAGALLIS